MADGLTIHGMGGVVDNTKVQSSALGNSVTDDLSRPNNQTIGNAGTRSSVPLFVSSVFSARSAKNLSPDGKRYLDTITDNCKQSGLKVDVLPQTNSYLIHNDKVGVALTFKEHIPTQTNMSPASKYNDRVFTEMKETRPSCDLLDAAIIIPNDYNRAEITANHIRNVINFSLGGDGIAFSEMIQCPYRLNTNTHAVSQVLNELSPHGVRGYTRYGFVLEVCTDQKKQAKFGRRNEEDDNVYTPILAVGAYTDFIKGTSYQTNRQMFSPMINISEAYSLIPSADMWPIVLALSTELFIGRNHWKEEFNNYSGSQPNIGALFLDANNRPSSVSSLAEREEFISSMCDMPSLVLHSQDGRLSIPGHQLFASPTGEKTLLNAFSAYFMNPAINDLGRLTGDCVEEYQGICRIGADDVDTRSVDYFTVVGSNQGCDSAQLDRFLMHDGYRPDARLNDMVAANYNQITSLYSTMMCLLEPSSMLQLAQIVGSAFPSLNQDLIASNNWNYGFVRDAGRQYREGFEHSGGSFFRSGNSRFSGWGESRSSMYNRSFGNRKY